MNVRRAHLEGFDNQRIDQLDQRGVSFHHRAVIRASRPDLDVLLGKLLDGLGQLWIRRAAAFFAIVSAERRLDVRLGSDLQIDLHPQQVGETVDGIEVGRIRQRDRQRAIVLIDGHDPIFSGDVPRDGGDDLIGDF